MYDSKKERKRKEAINVIKLMRYDLMYPIKSHRAMH